MAAHWSPCPQTALHISQLVLSASVPSGKSQLDTTRSIEHFVKTVSDADNYLCAIMLGRLPLAADVQKAFKESIGVEDAVRSMSGILLKNSLKAKLAAGNTASAYQLREAVLSGLTDPSVLVQSTVGNVLAVLFQGMGASKYPEIIPRLAQLGSPASLSALEKIFADSAYEIVKELDAALLADAIDALIGLIPKYPRLSITCLNELIMQYCPVFEARVPAFMHALSAASSSDEWQVRQAVCIALNYLMDAHPDILHPFLPSILQHQLAALTPRSRDSTDERSVAMEATDFWQCFAEKDEAVPGVSTSDTLVPALPQLLPALLRNMLLTEEDPEWDSELQGLDDPRRPDSTAAPRHHSGAQHGGNEEDQGESDEEQEEEDYAWTLRKSSAMALDTMASALPPSALTAALLPLINDMLADSSSEWQHAEAAILAIGAIADGCYEAMEPHLPKLVPFLLHFLQHPRPLVRSISAWTLSRYAPWFATADTRLCAQAAGLLISMLLDRQSKRVQRAGLTAIGELFTEAADAMTPHTPLVIQAALQVVAGECRPFYQTRSFFGLCDMLESVADAVGEALLGSSELPALVGHLVQRWFEQPADRYEDINSLFPLLECLCAMAIAAGAAFGACGDAAFRRSLAIVTSGLQHYQQLDGEDGNAGDDILDYVVAAADLIGGLLQGRLPLDTPSLHPVVLACCQHENADVRQSGFALLGDLAQTRQFLVDCLPHFLAAIARNAHPNYVEADNDNDDDEGATKGRPEFVVNSSVANNAVWSLGELACNQQIVGEHTRMFLPFIDVLRHELVSAMPTGKKDSSPAVDRTYLGNVAVCFARCLRLLQPVVSRHEQLHLLGASKADTVRAWEWAMEGVADDAEKGDSVQAFKAFLASN